MLGALNLNNSIICPLPVQISPAACPNAGLLSLLTEVHPSLLSSVSDRYQIYRICKYATLLFMSASCWLGLVRLCVP